MFSILQNFTCSNADFICSWVLSIFQESKVRHSENKRHKIRVVLAETHMISLISFHVLITRPFLLQSSPLQSIPLQSQLSHYNKLLVLQESHFTAYATFILRSDMFWTTNHTRVLWKQLGIILPLRSESLDMHMLPVNKACTGISKYHSLYFLCEEIFCVPIYSTENINPNKYFNTI